MNGVIISDERLHQDAWKKFVQAHNFQLTEDDFKQRIFGRSERDAFQFLFGHQLNDQEVAAYSDERLGYFFELHGDHLELVAGLIPFLESLQKHKIDLAVATSSRRRYQEFVFRTFDLGRFFKAVITSQDVENGKPHPEIYEKAAQAINQLPEDCLAFEDTHSGIQAARAAGMKVVGVATTHSAAELTKADLVIKNFMELNFEQLKRLDTMDLVM